jgi:hypothetical protein
VRLDAARAARAIVEAQRNMGENPLGFAAPAVLCLHGDEAACDAVAALTRERPMLHRAAARLEAIRATAR